MKKPETKALKKFIEKLAPSFNYDFKETARDNYDYARRQYDTVTVEISPTDALNTAYFLELTLTAESLHDVSVGGWDEEPCHDIEIVNIEIDKIIFWLDEKEYDLSNERKALKLIKNYVNNE